MFKIKFLIIMIINLIEIIKNQILILFLILIQIKQKKK